jgi:hypothetical protein
MNFYDLVDEKYKNKIIEWLHDRIEFLYLCYDDLMIGKMRLYYHNGRQNKTIDGVTISVDNAEKTSPFRTIVYATDIIRQNEDKNWPVPTNICVSFQDCPRIITKNIIEHITFYRRFPIKKRPQPRNRLFALQNYFMIKDKNHYDQI